MSPCKYLFFLLSAWQLPFCGFALDLTTGKDEQSKLPYWQIDDGGISLRLVQRLPDQTRALYMRLGFSNADAETIALRCAFQTIFKNTSQQVKPSALRYDLREWVVHIDNQKHGLSVREDWEQEWLKKAIPDAARRNFSWGLVPTEMQYEPGDYNWGMTFYNLKPGSVFNLMVVWHQYGEMKTYTIENLQCAPDIHPNPEEFRNSP